MSKRKLGEVYYHFNLDSATGKGLCKQERCGELIFVSIYEIASSELKFEWRSQQNAAKQVIRAISSENLEAYESLPAQAMEPDFEDESDLLQTMLSSHFSSQQFS